MAKPGKLRTELTARVLDHPEIELKKSRFADKEAFFVGTREIGHFHSNNEVDIRLTRPVMKKLGLTKSEDRRIKIRSKSTDWVEFVFKREDDLLHAVELFDAAAKANRK